LTGSELDDRVQVMLVHLLDELIDHLGHPDLLSKVALRRFYVCQAAFCVSAVVVMVAVRVR
jgi:hypothetical protein